MSVPIRSVLVVCGLSLVACSTARINQFDRFSEAGLVYVEAVDQVTREAARTAIDADSAALARVRDALPEAERDAAIVDHNALLRVRLELLGDIRRHGHLLRAYFVALLELSETDAPAAAAAAAGDLVASMSAISQRLATVRIGGDPIESFSGSVIGISVARFQHAALERELETRAEAIERELDFQQAAMQAIAEQMKTDLKAVLSHRELVEIIDPYRGGNVRLPKGWAKNRRELLAASASVASVEAAAEAARQLKWSYVALVENRLSAADLQALLSDVNEILSLLERIAQTSTE